MHFADSLTERTKQTSPVCVGLDPDLKKLPEGIAKTPEGVLAISLPVPADVVVCDEARWARMSAESTGLAHTIAREAKWF